MPRPRSPHSGRLAGLIALGLLELAPRIHAQPAEADANAAADATDDGATFEGALSAGGGAGVREVRVPTTGGERRLESSLFPALDLGVRADARAGEHLLLGARFRYRTSVGLRAEETPDLGATRRTPLRSHHVELAALTGLRFTPSRDAVMLGLLAGWMIRGLRALVDTTLPPYTLHGPVFRLELRLPIAADRVQLRLAPELFVPISAGDELREVVVLDGPGLALGGEASVGVRLGDAFSVEVCYRESHASVPAAAGGSFTDSERFGTVQAVLRY